jgi:hypothetical protein
MTYTVTKQNLIVNNGGGRTPATGHRSHLAIYKGEDGKEYVYFQKKFQLVSALGLKSNNREQVSRGE